MICAARHAEPERKLPTFTTSTSTRSCFFQLLTAAESDSFVFLSSVVCIKSYTALLISSFFISPRVLKNSKAKQVTLGRYQPVLFDGHATLGNWTNNDGIAWSRLPHFTISQLEFTDHSTYSLTSSSAIYIFHTACTSIKCIKKPHRRKIFLTPEQIYVDVAKGHKLCRKFFYYFSKEFSST